MGAGGHRPAAGFTVVELVAVIVLLAILGVAAISRMPATNVFGPAVISQALAAEAGVARQLAASRHDAAVTLRVDRLGSQWRLRIATDVDGVVRSELVDAPGTALQAASGMASGPVSGSEALTVGFDRRGELASVQIGAAAGDPALGVEITVSGDHSRTLCLYPSGYAHPSACS